jgi:hypothetical protein
MHRAVAQRSITSLFLAASERDHERMMRQLAPGEDAEAASRELKGRYELILALLVRRQDELGAVLRKLGPNEQKPFCEVLSELLVDLAFTGGFRKFRDELIQERREVDSAVEVLCSFCKRLHRDGLVGEEIGGFVDSLQRLDDMSEFIAIHDLDAISWMLPNSRKAGGNFFGECISRGFLWARWFVSSGGSAIGLSPTQSMR